MASSLARRMPDCEDWLHLHLVSGCKIPDAPKLRHFGRRAQGYADVVVEGRERTADCDAIFLEMLDDLQRGSLCVHHHEVRVRIDGTQHARVGLIEELLAAVS